MSQNYWLLSLYCLCLISVQLIAQPNTSYKLSQPTTRLSIEDSTLVNQESMGLMGVHLELKPLPNKHAYLGIGGYGAFTGDRGGFFTAGITPGFSGFLFKKWRYDTGFFLGGGGGASAFPGDGLMLRAHGYLGYPVSRGHLWFGAAWRQISHIDCGTTLTVALSQPVSLFIEQPNVNSTIKVSSNVLIKKPLNLAVFSTYYLPFDQYMGRNQSTIQKQIPLLSLNLQKFWSPSGFVQLTLSGAHGSGADGYGAILGGLGYQKEFQRWIAQAGIQLGMSGGGNIDTGSGFILKPGGLLGYRLTPRLTLVSSAHYISAPSGSFQASALAIGLTKTWQQVVDLYTPYKSPFVLAKNASQRYSLHWFIETKTVYPVASLTNKNNQRYANSIENFGCGVRVPLHKNWALLLATYWAYNGNVGAYAEGDIGLSWLKQLDSRWFTQLDVAIGAAGGGGIDVNTGTIHQETILLGYNTTSQAQLFTKIGWQGAFNTASYRGLVLCLGLQKKLYFL